MEQAQRAMDEAERRKKDEADRSARVLTCGVCQQPIRAGEGYTRDVTRRPQHLRCPPKADESASA